jgi:hypothetical protein
MPWTGARGPGPPVHGGPIKGVRPLSDLGRPRRSDGRRPAAPGRRRRRGSPAMARSAIRAPNRAEISPGGRGEDKEAHQGLGGEGIRAEEEIGAARRSSGGSSGAAALHTREREREWCGVTRRWCSFFIGRRGKGRRRGEAVAGARRPAINGGGGGSGSAGDGACGGEERVWERGRVKGQPQGSLGRLYRARRGERGIGLRRNGHQCHGGGRS